MSKHDAWPSRTQARASQSAARTMQLAAFRQLGLLRYCQVRSVIGANTVAAQRRITGRLSPKTDQAAPPSGRRIGRLLMADTVMVAKRLHHVLRKEANEPLQDVLAAAADTLLAGFAANLSRDQDAVQAALDLPWTTSPVERQVNRIKAVKRSMYGRAGFDLARRPHPERRMTAKRQHGKCGKPQFCTAHDIFTLRRQLRALHWTKVFQRPVFST